MELNETRVDLRTINDRLRNSLTGILGNAYFLSEEYLTPTQQEMVKVILTCAGDLKKLADDMLEKKMTDTFSHKFSIS